MPLKTIFVIMAAFLGEYPTGAKKREEKFIRAVDSFLDNTYLSKKLIIIADGCEITRNLYSEKYGKNQDIIFLYMSKQVLFSGKIRNCGLDYVKRHGNPDDLVCYLDTDDKFGENHLETIVSNFGDNDFVIYNVYRPFVYPEKTEIRMSTVSMKPAHVGTSSFAHKAGCDIKWSDGYGHDWKLLKEISEKYKYSVISTPSYYVLHTANYDG